MQLQRARDLADLLFKGLSMCAILIVGLWGAYQFWITDWAADSVQLAIASESLPYSANTQLLLVHVKAKNLSKVRVTPGKKGMVIMIRNIPSEAKEGIIDLERQPKFYRATRFADGTELEAGVEYDEVLALLAPKNTLYSVKATFDLDNNIEVNRLAVVGGMGASTTAATNNTASNP